MKLTIIIVSYNVRDYLGQCLRSIDRAMSGLDVEVIVVDNCSKDGTVDGLSKEFPWVRLIKSNRNLGFAKANNQAIRTSKSEYVLLLNPDTIIGEDVLRYALQFMDTNPKAGGAGVRMLRRDGYDALESRRGVPTPMTAFYKMVGLCARFPYSRRFGRYYMGYLSWNEPSKIEVISGAFCLLRREALEKVGLLDEDFFMYGEDIDLSYRLLKGGWDNWYLPLRILHYKGESTQKTSFRYVHVFYEAMFIFLRKHYGHLSVFLGIPIRFGILFKAIGTLITTWWHKLRSGLGFVSKRKVVDPQYVFDVSEDSKPQCRLLIERYGLTARFVDDTELLLLVDDMQKSGLVYFVYDTLKYTYHEILEHFSAMAKDNLRIGVYHPEVKRLITDNEIMQ